MKLLIMDVDGTLTDGRIYMGINGEILKAFNAKDGSGIHDILPIYDIVPIIITGRNSQIVLNRARELGITDVFQGTQDKLNCLNTILNKYNCTPSDVAYIGDDILDLPAMRICGIKGCPADAIQDVRDVCDYVCTSKGGHGAVREFIEWLILRRFE